MPTIMGCSYAKKEKDTEVTGIRYFKTRRGLGYEVSTNNGNTIWNDGMGGGTFIETEGGGHYHEFNGLKGMYLEDYLESLINKYEGV